MTYTQRISDAADVARATAYIAGLPKSVPYVLTIKPWHKQRTVRQNKLYRVWLHRMSDYTGYTEEEMHDYYKTKFLLGRKVFDDIVAVPSTKHLTTAEFSGYLQKVHQHYLDKTDEALPWPDDAGWEDLCARYS